MTSSDALRFVEFSPEHLPGALRLSQQVSWPHRSQDWALTLSQSTGVVACDGETVVGTALVALFDDVATLSMIIVDESLRGRRLGRKLMDAIMECAGDREMRLIATSDGLPLYQKLGFEITGNILQHQGSVTPVAPEFSVREGHADLDQLVAMDQAATGINRRDLLSRITAEGTVLQVANSFAVLRDFGRGKVLGPIVAEDLASAKALLCAASQSVPGGFLRIDTPVPDLGAFAATLGLTHVGGGTCMVLNAKTQQKETSTRTFGLVSQALG